MKRFTIIFSVIILAFIAAGQSDQVSGKSGFIPGQDEIPGEPNPFEPRVVGGSEVDPPNSYPWMVSIQYDGYHLCGGTLINEEWVLTAAQCWASASTGQPLAILPEHTVVLGEHNYQIAEGPEQVIAPDAVHLHPQWNHNTLEYNLALLHLSEAATPTAAVQPVSLLPGTAPDNQDATIAGWGAISGDELFPSDVLLEGQLQILPESACEVSGLDFYPDSMLCAAVADFSVDACPGDEGGPLFYHDGSEWLLAGVTTRETGCGTVDYPSYYARVSTVGGWLQAIDYSCASQSAIPAAECEQLKTLYISTGGSGWADSTGWLATDDPCGWYGLTCESGQISRIELQGNQLYGEFAADFSAFSNLTVFILQGNQISGVLGDIVSKLPTGLSELHLGLNNISGEIPASLLNFTQLGKLVLSANMISGDITAAINNLPANLEWIMLDLNMLSGPIPTTISKFTSMVGLDLGYNQLNGDWLDMLNALPNGMEWIGFGDSELYAGEIPESLAVDHPNLMFLDVSGNYLFGSLPQSISGLTSLTHLWVGNTFMDGEIPFDYANLTQLDSFHYENTDICAPTTPGIQTWLAGISDVAASGLLCDYTKPIVTITNPITNGTVPIPKGHIVVDAYDQHSGMHKIECHYSTTLDNWVLLGTDDLGSNGWTCVLGTTGLPSGFNLKVVAYDFDGNTNEALATNLSTTTAPKTNLGGFEARQGGGEPDDAIQSVSAGAAQIAPESASPNYYGQNIKRYLLY